MTESDRNPPFNMAVATLMRLDAILKEIKMLHFRYAPYSSPKQNAHLNLAKEFYVNAVPLLDDNAKDYEWILKESMNRKLHVSNGNQRYTEVYDSNKDVKLNTLVADIQLKLKKFFMPSRDEDDDDY